MRSYFKFLALILAFCPVFIERAAAQEQSQEQPIKKPGRLLPALIRFDGGVQGTEPALNSLRNTYLLDSRVGFTRLRSKKDELGLTHTRYLQTYDGYPVSGGMIIVHQDREGAVQTINGDVFAIPQAKPGASAVSERMALTAALKETGAQEYLWEGDSSLLPAAYAAHKTAPRGTLVWAPKDGAHGLEPMRLAWKFDVYARKPLGRWFVYVDAIDGIVLWKEDRIREGWSNGSANTLFSGVKAIITDSMSATSFRLWDTTRGGGIRTQDLNTGTTIGSAVDFIDADNYWNNSANFDRAAGDVHWGHEKVYDYFDTAHNRQSFDDLAAPLNGYVHYSTNLVNAFWDGTALYYGDGDANQGFSPITCIDIVGHEFTHGVTEYSADLIYSYQSGALNESFSDIFGNVLERVTKPTTASWKVGEEVTSNGNGIRNMADPGQHSHPDTYLGTHWYTGTLDNGGVHINSGVQNFWFHVLAAGDTGTNDINHAYSVPGIGIHKAAKIAYRSLTTYLTPTSQYADARTYSIQAAKDLYGACSQEVIQTTNAWHAVGVGAAYQAGGAVTFTATPTSSCHVPATVQFTNTSANVLSSQWTFGNGGTSTATSPSYTYNANGQYTVKLKVTRCNSTVDSVTYTNFITLDTTATLCDTVILTTNTQQTLSACSGVIVDNGGVNGPYTNGVNSGVLVTATTGSYVRFKFSHLNLESGYDYVTVYNGATTSAPVIGTYSGGTLPANGGWINTAGNQFLVRFVTDGSVTYSGFVMQFECVTVPPAVAFYSPDTVSCNPLVTFVNTSVPTNGSTWSWDFGDGTTSTLVNPTKIYTAQGTYTVKLKACNSFGCDSLTRTAYIKYDTALSVCNTFSMPTSGSTTLTKCTGIITDNGGIAGPYSNYVSSSVQVNTAAGSTYRFRFTQFETEWGFDYVRVYNGGNSSAPLLGQYSGTSLPAGGAWMYTTGPQLFVQFFTDGSVVDDGFVLQYECLNAPPTVSFHSPDTVTCDPSVVFVNTTAPVAGNTYLWNFGDSTTSTVANPTKVYAAQGTYTVKLKACNSFGCDSLTRTAYINYDTTQLACQTSTIPGSTAVVRCNGWVTDNGGHNGNYSSYAYGGVAVSTTSANSYRLRFTQLRLQPGTQVIVYNGGNSGAPVLGTYTGTTLPNNGAWLYTTGAQFYVVFSAGSAVDSGFKIQYECQNIAPTAAFYSPDTVTCNNSVVFVNTTAPVAGNTYLWSFGDGTTSTLANPTKSYTAQGIYTVKLKACNSIGCDSLTRTAYINYDTALSVCNTFSMPTSGSTTLTKCTGIITDNGGIAGMYSDYVSSSVQVNTAAGSTYRFRFTQFETESGYDYVRVYNGGNSSAPLLGQYSGTSLPAGGAWMYTTGPQLFVQFFTDGSVVYNGFVLQYECLPGVAANFHSPDTISCDSFVTFINTSANASAYVWDFGDGTTSTVANPVKSYAASGIYTVSLTACNSTGVCSTYTRPAYINYNPITAEGIIPDTVLPATNFTLASTTTGAVSTEWHIDGAVVAQAPALVTQLSTLGIHTVRLIVSNSVCTDTLLRTIWVGSLPNTVGTAVTGSSHFQLYPNPANRKLTLAFNNGGRSVREVSYRIRSAAGQLVATGKAPVTGLGVYHTIDLPELAAGIYSFTLEAGTEVQTVLFRVQQ